MKHRLLRAAFVLTALGVPVLLLCQEGEPARRLTLSLGGGFTTPTGTVASDLDHGGNFELNSGYFVNRNFGITGTFLFSDGGITRPALDALNEPDGTARIYALTVDPTVRLPLRRGFVAYALAGGGYVARDLHFVKPVLIGYSTKHMPFMLMPGYASNGSIINNSGGFDVGGGLNMPSPWKPAKSFVEARFVKGFTSNLNTTVVPITVGIRW